MTENEYVVVARHYGLDQPPNFENKYWHLRVSAPAGDERLLEQAKAQLFAAREKRVRPGRDEKILVSWNALAIRGMARAGRVFGRPEWSASARARWSSSARKCGAAGASLPLTGRPRPLERLSGRLRVPARCTARADAKPVFHGRPGFAEALAGVLLEQFEDRTPAASSSPRAITSGSSPSQAGHDNATPSGNAVAAWALGRLAALTGNERHARAAQRTLELFYVPMRDYPRDSAP